MLTKGNLCLGEPLAVWKTFSEQPTLLDFQVLVPYLYSYSYFANMENFLLVIYHMGSRVGVLSKSIQYAKEHSLFA